MTSRSLYVRQYVSSQYKLYELHYCIKLDNLSLGSVAKWHILFWEWLLTAFPRTMAWRNDLCAIFSYLHLNHFELSRCCLCRKGHCCTCPCLLHTLSVVLISTFSILFFFVQLSAVLNHVYCSYSNLLGLFVGTVLDIVYI